MAHAHSESVFRADHPPPNRALSWQLRTRTLQFHGRPLLMGILNVTPDSFSDGGRFLEVAAAVDHARRLVADGADLLDVGGESTRPYSEPVAAVEQLRRVLPLLERLAGDLSIPLSIDTQSAAVAREAISAGAEIINDVSGLEADPDMVPLATACGAGLCVMHMQGTPRTMQLDPTYTDVVAEVRGYLARRRDALVAAGVDRARICIDPGIGFGKTQAHNLALMAGCAELHAIGCPLLVGPSRKGFLGKLLGDDRADRLQATVGAALALALAGVQIIRVHDVRPVREALAAFEACGGLRPEGPGAEAAGS